ncbi:DGQHR domain-containing protein DpdB [bacterium]|nr:DGQHR domain-containing protein DpdB [bacterium]MDB4458539.1 DGQHR domain-containing protein DpdB [bacterium]
MVKKKTTKKSKPLSNVLRLPAIKVKQGKNRILYSFAVDGKELPDFAAISRISRDDDEEIEGYQRPEVLAHISEIRSYLESENPMIPNALVIAFDNRVKFEPSSKSRAGGNSYSQTGTLLIPIDKNAKDADKAGWIVDGQQRTAAIRDAEIKKFPMCAVGFVAKTDAEQREQFILVNSTKPLPKGLIYELLPSTEAKLPTLLEKRKFPSMLLGRLNRDPGSPFEKMIRTPTNSNPDAVIADNSILKMVENSLTEGVLYRYRDEDGDGDVEAMVRVLTDYWLAVREVFPDAWGLITRKSRLMHGAGIVSMGYLMDAIADRHRGSGKITVKDFVNDLRPIQAECHWTKGYWDFGPDTKRKWDEVQNIPRDIQLLTNHLLMKYKKLVWDKEKPQKAKRKSKKKDPNQKEFNL